MHVAFQLNERSQLLAAQRLLVEERQGEDPEPVPVQERGLLTRVRSRLSRGRRA